MAKRKEPSSSSATSARRSKVLKALNDLGNNPPDDAASDSVDNVRDDHDNDTHNGSSDDVKNDATDNIEDGSNNGVNVEEGHDNNVPEAGTKDQSTQSSTASDSSPDMIFHQVVGNNPFSSLFPAEKSVLEGVIVVTSVKRPTGVIELQAVDPINLLEAHRPTEALRLLKCAAHPDNTTIKWPKGGVINVALADPTSLSVDPKTGYLMSEVNKTWVVSSLLGETTYFSHSTIRQICITPFSHGWYRFASVLSKVYGQDALYFQSFMDGLTFGTNRYESTGLSVAGKRAKSHSAPIGGSTIKAGGDIPVYDGRDKFQLGKYWDRPYTGKVAKGATVMLLFSIKKGNLPGGVQKIQGFPTAIEFAIYLNILGIIVLAEPAENFSEGGSQEGPEAFGVSAITRWSAPVEEDTNDEESDEVIEEQFL